jgi:hypothetical protein
MIPPRRRTSNQCSRHGNYDLCDLNNDYFLQFQFLNWELEAQNLPAALRRLRESDWKSMEPAVTLRVARAYILAGRQSDIPDILSELSNRFRAAAEQGLLQPGAAIRHTVNIGDIGRAMQTTLCRPRVADRVVGLTIIAEALANLPGLEFRPHGHRLQQRVTSLRDEPTSAKLPFSPLQIASQEEAPCFHCRFPVLLPIRVVSDPRRCRPFKVAGYISNVAMKCCFLTCSLDCSGDPLLEQKARKVSRLGLG